MSDITAHAAAVDAALNQAFSTERIPQGNNFEWLSHLESVKGAKMAIDSGIVDIEKIAAASHSGWVQAVKDDFNNEMTLDTPTNDERKRKRFLMSQLPYEHFPDAEKEKFRHMARTMLNM
jgi:hypothetical protein